MKFTIEKLGERKGKTHTWTQVRIVFEGDPGGMQMIYVPNEVVDVFIEFMIRGPSVFEAAHDLIDNHFDPVFGVLADVDEQEVRLVDRAGKLWEVLNTKLPTCDCGGEALSLFAVHHRRGCIIPGPHNDPIPKKKVPY